METNTDENARLAFETKVTDLLQDLVETNFKLYKRITDEQRFREILVDHLYTAYRKRVSGDDLTEAHVRKEIEGGETKHREFKSSLRLNLHTEDKDDRVTLASLKTIAAFENTEGGVLYIGIDDDGASVGIEQDGFANDDKFLLHLNNMVTKSMGQTAASRITPSIWVLDGHAVCRIECQRSPKPVFVKFQGKESFFVRTGPSTAEMTPSEMHAYVSERFPQP